MKHALERRLARVLHRNPLKLKQGQSRVCITFDDVPMTACALGAEIMETHGARATYYVSAHFETHNDSGRFHTGEVLRDLHDRGHEIGCHGAAHLHYQQTSSPAIRQDIAENRAYFEANTLPPARSFAYPYSGVSPRIKRLCGAHYPVCRGITAGLNQGTIDSHLLRAVPLYDAQWSLAQSRTILEQAARDGGLLVFFTHGVEADPGVFDCSVALLDDTLRAARDLGLDISTLHAAVRDLAEDAPAALS